MDKKYEVISSRKNAIYKERCDQWIINCLAYDGGRPYIDARLTRFPAEADCEWFGNARITGRKDRAFFINHPRRIVDKLNQYVFQTIPIRQDLEQPYTEDIDLQGHTINQFMEDLSTAITLYRFAWVLVDRDALAVDENGKTIPQSRAEKKSRKDRVYWMLYTPPDVVDWKISEENGIEWVLTEEKYVDDANPWAMVRKKKTRTLWEPDKKTTFYFGEENDKIWEEVVNTSGRMQWILVGGMNDRAWWFDDIEATARSMMDLQSSYDKSLFDTVYVQRVLPADAIRQLTESSDGISYDRAISMVLSEQTPIMETGDSKGISRYIQPNTSSEILRRELDARKNELYDIVGLGLATETRQVKSGVALHWENLDPESAFAERARLLESAEQELAQLSNFMDSDFPLYTPEYNKKFDMSDWKEDLKIMLEIGKSTLPERANKILILAIIERLKNVNGFSPTDEEWVEIEKQVEEMDLSTPEMMALDAMMRQAPDDPSPNSGPE